MACHGDLVQVQMFTVNNYNNWVNNMYSEVSNSKCIFVPLLGNYKEAYRMPLSINQVVGGSIFYQRHNFI